MSCDRHVFFDSDCAGCRHGREMSQAKDMAKQSERQHADYMKRSTSEPLSFKWNLIKGAAWFLFIIVAGCVVYGFTTDGDVFESVGAVLTFIFDHLALIVLVAGVALTAWFTRKHWVPAVRRGVADRRAETASRKGRTNAPRIDPNEDFSSL